MKKINQKSLKKTNFYQIKNKKIQICFKIKENHFHSQIFYQIIFKLRKNRVFMTQQNKNLKINKILNLMRKLRK